MTTLLNTADFNGTQLPVISHDNDYWMTSDDVGLALEYDEPRQSIINLYNRHSGLLNDYSRVINLVLRDHDGTARKRDVRVFNEEGVMLIAMKSNQPKAIEFQRWAVQILKAYRHNQLLNLNAEIVRKQEEIKLLRKRACWARANMQAEEAHEVIGFRSQGKTFTGIVREGLTFRSAGGLSNQLRRWMGIAADHAQRTLFGGGAS